MEQVGERARPVVPCEACEALWVVNRRRTSPKRRQQGHIRVGSECDPDPSTHGRREGTQVDGTWVCQPCIALVVGNLDEHQFGAVSTLRVELGVDSDPVDGSKVVDSAKRGWDATRRGR